MIRPFPRNEVTRNQKNCTARWPLWVIRFAMIVHNRPWIACFMNEIGQRSVADWSLLQKHPSLLSFRQTKTDTPFISLCSSRDINYLPTNPSLEDSQLHGGSRGHVRFFLKLKVTRTRRLDGRWNLDARGDPVNRVRFYCIEIIHQRDERDFQSISRWNNILQRLFRWKHTGGIHQPSVISVLVNLLKRLDATQTETESSQCSSSTRILTSRFFNNRPLITGWDARYLCSRAPAFDIDFLETGVERDWNLA